MSRQSEGAVDLYVSAMRRGDFVGAIEALRVVDIARMPASGWEPPLDVEQILSVRDAATTRDALYNLGAAVWGLSGYELLGVEILAESARHGSPDGRAATGDALAWLGMPELAHEWLERSLQQGVIDSDPQRGAWLAGLLGEALEAQGSGSTRSLALLERAAAAHDEFGVSFAKALRSNGELLRSRRILESLTDKAVYGAALQLGNLVWDEFDDRDAAERAYRAGVETEDGHCAYNLGLLFRELGRSVEAEAAFARALTLGDLTAPPDETLDTE